MQANLLSKPKLMQYIYAVFMCITILFYSSCRKAGELKPLENSEAVKGMDLSSIRNGRPNIILILGDDIGYGVPTCNGGESYKTPNIDRMAAEGMRFTNCYSAPLCSPSRFMFVTGKYNFRNYTFWGAMDPNEKTFANIMQDAGYATYVAGKWQFDGGDVSIKNQGYDDYAVWNPFKQENGSKYKNPKIYEKGAYLPDSETLNGYGDDIFTDSILSFVKSNKDNNFFVYYPITLCHYPYVPTPDDPQFENWNNRTDQPDTAYFPSMVKYMDKKIGQIMDSLKAWRLIKNTIVMFVGDNGTPHDIWFSQDGVYQEGGKSNSNASGTHVPLIVCWPKGIVPGQVNNNLVDFTDFVPTVADAAGTTIPGSFGTVDGVSFFNQLRGVSTEPRSWVFCHYAPNTNSGNTIVKRWINDTNYKLYDSTGKFYNILLDPEEISPIKKSAMTTDEKNKKSEFQQIMNTLK
jgi:arylsulfatase A-like enzyme